MTNSDIWQLFAFTQSLLPPNYGTIYNLVWFGLCASTFVQDTSKLYKTVDSDERLRVRKRREHNFVCVSVKKSMWERRLAKMCWSANIEM